MKSSLLIFLLMPLLLSGQLKKQEKIAEMQFNYDFNSYQLSKEELVKLNRFIENYADKVHFIVISSGTDSIGNLSKNQELSEKRSKTVFDILLKEGFDKTRIRLNNHGEHSPTADNNSEEGRRNNRYSRVELFEEKINLENHISISASLKDDETNMPIADSMVLVFHKEEPDTFYSDKKGNLQIIVPDSVKVVDIFVKDYFFATVEVDKEKNKDVKIEVPVKKAKKGNKANFDNILFVGDKAVMITGSYKTCDKIARFLKYNPQRVVEIAGHINQPNMPKVPVNSSKFELSEQRALRVCNYLIEKGIAKERLIAKGYGNWEMLFPVAITEEEQRKNRRVELRIIE